MYQLGNAVHFIILYDEYRNIYTKYIENRLVLWFPSLWFKNTRRFAIQHIIFILAHMQLSITNRIGSDCVVCFQLHSSHLTSANGRSQLRGISVREVTTFCLSSAYFPYHAQFKLKCDPIIYPKPIYLTACPWFAYEKRQRECLVS